MSKQYLRNFGIPALVLATFYVACADPPKKPTQKGGAGAGGEIAGETGGSDTAGNNATSGSGGSGAVSAGDAGMGGEAGSSEGGAAGEAGAAPASGGTAGTGGGNAQGGKGGATSEGCAKVTIGQSKLPVPPAPATPVAKPTGAVGGLTVVNWAGFKGALSYTFDDSNASQVVHYEELNAVGIPMTFYLINGNQGSNPIWVKAIADGHELGNHTVHHCNFNGSGCVQAVTTFNADVELDDNTTFLMAKTGMTGVYTFASPNGDSGWMTPAKTRFLLGRGVSDYAGASIYPTTSLDSAFNLPCHITIENETADGLATPNDPNDGLNLVADNVRANGSWRTILMHGFTGTNDYAYHPIDIKEAVATMTYTKNLGDVWADTVIAIGSYWVAQKTITPVQATTVGSDKVYSWTLPEHFPPGKYLRVTTTGGTVKQCGTELAWDDHGYYEINLDAGSVTISP
ncbi:MAG TPA: polysaccharide deacetylase family protein [Polyangiaceae bacterium]|nr:polysaccharide deacetylase family protein [Polyangiaceae bacterium]